MVPSCDQASVAMKEGSLTLPKVTTIFWAFTSQRWIAEPLSARYCPLGDQARAPIDHMRPGIAIREGCGELATGHRPDLHLGTLDKPRAR